jgi:hypothetical protein
VAILVLAGIVTALELTNTTHWFHTKPTGVAGNSYTKGDSNGSQSPTNTDDTNSTKPETSDSSPSDNQSDAKSDAPLVSGKLQAPQGTFANVYEASPDDEMGSTCNTTPGATCQILFTKDGVTKSLPKENTDKGGAVFWSWTPKKIGLTTGTWHITAKATLGSQVKTTNNDPLTLEIK